MLWGARLNTGEGSTSQWRTFFNPFRNMKPLLVIALPRILPLEGRSLESYVVEEAMQAAQFTCSFIRERFLPSPWELQTIRRKQGIIVFSKPPLTSIPRLPLTAVMRALFASIHLRPHKMIKRTPLHMSVSFANSAGRLNFEVDRLIIDHRFS
jgi:hypothetical protein